MRQFDDSALEPLFGAHDEAARDDAIAELIEGRARGVIDRVLAPYRRAGFALSPQDADDIAASVALRLLRKLRSMETAAYESIESFDGYVATLTFNEAYDFFRARHGRIVLTIVWPASAPVDQVKARVAPELPRPTAPRTRLSAMRRSLGRVVARRR